MTVFIEAILGRFTDERLGLLQAATENGDLEYWNTCGCLNFYHQGDYYLTRQTIPEAFKAEEEFRDLSDTADMERELMILGNEFRVFKVVQRGEAQRRERMLPLIKAEWEKRAQPMPVTFTVREKQEVLK